MGSIKLKNFKKLPWSLQVKLGIANDEEVITLNEEQAFQRLDDLNQATPDDDCSKKEEAEFNYWAQRLRSKLYQVLSPPAKPAAKKSRWRKIGFWLLMACGVFTYACEGFDGIASMFSMLPAMSAAIPIAVGIAFAALYVAIFFGFYAKEVAKNLGLNINKSKGLLASRAAEVEQIEQIYYDILRQSVGGSLSPVLKQKLEILKTRCEALAENYDQYQLLLRKKSLRVLKKSVSVITGLLFFSGGFFTGQALTLAIAGFFGASLSVVAWPVLVISIAAGIAMLAQYWFVERPGLENLVGKCFGLDEEKVEMLEKCKPGSDDSLAAKISSTLERVEENHVSSTGEMLEKCKPGSDDSLAAKISSTLERVEENHVSSTGEMFKEDRLRGSDTFRRTFSESELTRKTSLDEWDSDPALSTQRSSV